jgi:hypothetical protein
MKILDSYFKLQQKIFDYFGYVEDYRVIPLDDQTGRHWAVIENEDGTGLVFWLDDGLLPTMEIIVKGEQIYGGEIYTQRFLPKYIYRAADQTMIAVDTHTDGNKFLMVFDNDKEITDAAMKKEYATRWSIV